MTALYQTKIIRVRSELETEWLAQKLAKIVEPPCIIFLEGPLGAGKTTFLRAILKALEFKDRIKSPTFTLIEAYDLNDLRLVHMDLYRLKDPMELEALGFRDYLTEETIFVIEWAKNAENRLPKPSLLCNIKIPENAEGRIFEFQAFSPVLKSRFEKEVGI
jgi:tRNA threonylcarbamoyladenosine biosynthesis protein TsaE